MEVTDWVNFAGPRVIRDACAFDTSLGGEQTCMMLLPTTGFDECDGVQTI